MFQVLNNELVKYMKHLQIFISNLTNEMVMVSTLKTGISSIKKRLLTITDIIKV